MRKAATADLSSVSVEGLVVGFEANSLAQYEAALEDNTRRVRALVFHMRDIQEELAARPGDQRRALLPMLVHENSRVRLNAAKALLALEPVKAREILKEVSTTRQYPQAADAGMTLRALDDGTFKPT